MSFFMMKSDGSIVDINASTIQLGVQCRGCVSVNACSKKKYAVAELVDYPAPYFVNVKNMK